MAGVTSDPPDTPPRGARFGRYRIVRRVGHGSFGTVYEALLPGPADSAQRVAIKKLRSHVVESEPTFVKSMANEARIGALLDHPNVVKVLQFGRKRDHYYLTMDFVDGADLGQLLTACRRREVGLPRFAVVDLARQIVRGLRHAHELRDQDGEPTELVHRDIKPSNVLIDRRGFARVSDFGVARSTTNLYVTTLSGVIKGTPRYMSPEQVVGERPLDRRSDLFSFGALLFQMITGDHLFDGKTLPSLAQAIMQKDLQPSLDVAEAALPGCRPVLDRLLRRDIDARYGSAGEVDEDLRSLSRSYPAASSLEDVFARLLPLVDRSDSAPIDDTAALERDMLGVDDFDAPPTSVEQLPEEGSTERRISQATEWKQFVAAFRPPDPEGGADEVEPEVDDPSPPSPPPSPPARRVWPAILVALAVLLAILLLGFLGTRLVSCGDSSGPLLAEGGWNR